jgi:hypothetical protein
MTIKGLEPEIQRLIAQHKTDTKRIEERHQDQYRHQVGPPTLLASLLTLV